MPSTALVGMIHVCVCIYMYVHVFFFKKITSKKHNIKKKLQLRRLNIVIDTGAYFNSTGSQEALPREVEKNTAK